MQRFCLNLPTPAIPPSSSRSFPFLIRGINKARKCSLKDLQRFLKHSTATVRWSRCNSTVNPPHPPSRTDGVDCWSELIVNMPPYDSSTNDLKSLTLKSCLGVCSLIGLLVVVPSVTYVDEPFSVIYKLTNQSVDKSLLLLASVDVNESFVFSGFKQTLVRLLPLESFRLYYRCWPLLTGCVRLPYFHLFHTQSDGSVGEELSVTAGAPLTVFVKPRKQLLK